MDFDRQLYEQQYQDSVDMYKMQLADSRENTANERAYNSPAAQAARLKAAGINPALQGVDSPASSAAATPQANVPKQNNPDFSSFIPTFALSMENLFGGLLDSLSKFEDLKAKRLANRETETSIADDLLQSIDVSDIDFNKVNWAEIPTDSRGLKKYLGGYWDDPQVDRDGGELLAAKSTANAYSPTQMLVRRIARIVNGTGLSKKQMRRVQRLALQRVQSLTQQSNAAKLERGIVEDIEGKNKAQSSPFVQRVDKNGVYSSYTDMVAEMMTAALEQARYERSSYSKQATTSEATGPIYELINKWKNSDKNMEKIGAAALAIVLEQIKASSLTLGRDSKRGGFMSFGL